MRPDGISVNRISQEGLRHCSEHPKPLVAASDTVNKVLFHITGKDAQGLDLKCMKTPEEMQKRCRQVRWNDLTYAIRPMEKEPVVHEVEIAKSEVLRTFRESTEKFLLSHDISDGQKVDVLNKTASLVHAIFEALQKNIPFEEALQQKTGEVCGHRPKPEGVGQAPDVSEIPLWQGRKKDGMPLDFLKTHYGQWLSAFGADRNHVFQDQIRAHDARLIKGIHNQFREGGKGQKLHDFVKPRSARVDRELENVSISDLKKDPRLAATLYSREKRAAKANTPAPSHPVAHKK